MTDSAGASCWMALDDCVLAALLLTQVPLSGFNLAMTLLCCAVGLLSRSMGRWGPLIHRLSSHLIAQTVYSARDQMQVRWK